MIFFTKIKITNETIRKSSTCERKEPYLSTAAPALRFGEGGVGVAVERHEQIAEVDPAGQHADERHDDVVDERCDDLPERAADNDADRHIDHVPLYGKFLEFLE